MRGKVLLSQRLLQTISTPPDPSQHQRAQSALATSGSRYLQRMGQCTNGLWTPRSLSASARYLPT